MFIDRVDGRLVSGPGEASCPVCSPRINDCSRGAPGWPSRLWQDAPGKGGWNMDHGPFGAVWLNIRINNISMEFG